MHIIKYYVLFIWVMITTKVLFAQPSHLKALWAVWIDESQQDNTRLNVIDDFIWEDYFHWNTRVQECIRVCSPRL